jgi:hypothetical protein
MKIHRWNDLKRSASDSTRRAAVEARIREQLAEMEAAASTEGKVAPAQNGAQHEGADEETPRSK